MRRKVSRGSRPDCSYRAFATCLATSTSRMPHAAGSRQTSGRTELCWPPAAAPPLVPESAAIPRDQGVGIGRIGLYDHGPVAIRQCREDLVPHAEVGHIKVRALDGFRKRKSEPTHSSQCDPTSTPHTTESTIEMIRFRRLTARA